MLSRITISEARRLENVEPHLLDAACRPTLDAVLLSCLEDQDFSSCFSFVASWELAHVQHNSEPYLLLTTRRCSTLYESFSTAWSSMPRPCLPEMILQAKA